ncbi:hypothetical protein XENOCAPTIV_030143, partial [Xenoophorus captivus]
CFMNLPSLFCQIISVPPEVANRRDVKQRSWSSAASPAHPGGYSGDQVQTEALATSTTIGRFSVVSTEDDITQRTRCSRYSAPPDFYLGTPPPMGKSRSLAHIQSSNSVPVDVTVHAPFLSADSGAESSPAKLAPATPSQHSRSERRGSDLMKRAVAFLRRTGRSSSVQSSDSPSRYGGVPGSAYASSDNDSEMEDSDIKRELQRLREKYDFLSSLCATPAPSEPAVSLNGSPGRTSFPTHGRPRSCTSHLPSSASEPVQTQQPCSLKGSLSSDNIYAGLHGDVAGTHAQPGLGNASPWTPPGPEACTLLWPDSPGPTVMASTSTGHFHTYQLHSPAAFTALPSPLSFNQWPGFYFPVSTGVFAFPAEPSTHSSLVSTSSHQLSDPEAKTL